MVKTTDDEQPSVSVSEILLIDADGNVKCVRCGWTHTTTNCAEYRLVHANRELEKVARFVHAEIGQGEPDETPVDTLLRWFKIRTGTEVTDMMKEE